MARRRPNEPELPEGTRLLDRYAILDRIGSGGMATIYRANDDRLDRVVCVKLLRTTLVEGSGSTGGHAVYKATYAHFLKEALALSKLSHQNTLRIYDFGYLQSTTSDANGAPFHVCEYLDGGNLETHIRLRGAITAEETLGILEAISGAVAEAHEHGIIHRDIKPSNILFARIRGDLVPKLADFGIAHSDLQKREDEADGESVSTVALFSPRWAAPEQLCGSPEGPKTDVYALGLLATFMLSGKVLFGDEDVRETFNDRVRSDDLVHARIGMVGITGEVALVLQRAMAARSDDRTDSAPDFFIALRDALRIKPSDSVIPFRAEPPPSGPKDVPVPPPAPLPHIPPPGPAAAPIAIEADDQQPALEQRYGERIVRFVQVHERLDLSFTDRDGSAVRVRVAMLPTLPGQETKLHVKGLTCWVARSGQRPTPALTIAQDGACDLLSAGREKLGELSIAFGQPNPEGRLFVVDGRQLLVPYSEAQQAVALTLSRGSDLVVMCRR